MSSEISDAYTLTSVTRINRQSEKIPAHDLSIHGSRYHPQRRICQSKAFTHAGFRRPMLRIARRGCSQGAAASEKRTLVSPRWVARVESPRVALRDAARTWLPAVVALLRSRIFKRPTPETNVLKLAPFVGSSPHASFFGCSLRHAPDPSFSFLADSHHSISVSSRLSLHSPNACSTSQTLARATPLLKRSSRALGRDPSLRSTRHLILAPLGETLDSRSARVVSATLGCSRASYDALGRDPRSARGDKRLFLLAPLLVSLARFARSFRSPARSTPHTRLT
jgi:hypothetical protein